MKNILFIVNTEGQLLTASSLIFERFNKATGYQPYVLQIGTTGSARFLNPVNKAMLSEYYWEIDRVEKDIKGKLKTMLHTRFERVFIFLEQLSLNVYLVNYFKKSGSIICLAPDGNKPYYTVDKAALGSRISQTIATYRYLFERGLYYFRPYFLSWNYARLNPVDELWVTYPEAFNNVRKKTVVGFQVLPGKKVADEVIAFFNFNVADPITQTDRVIFYANNILYQPEAYEVEIEAIKKIIEKFPGKPFYLKYHPSTPDFQMKKFKEQGVICFCNSKPAELYIASLTNSIIIGFWSTSLMVDNQSCKFYWLQKYLAKRGKMVDYINLANPTKHIVDVDNIDDIIF